MAGEQLVSSSIGVEPEVVTGGKPERATAEAWAAGAVVRKDSNGSGVVEEVVVVGNESVGGSEGERAKTGKVNVPGVKGEGERVVCGVAGLEEDSAASSGPGDNRENMGWGAEVAGWGWWRRVRGRRASGRRATGRVLDGDKVGLVGTAGVAAVRGVGGRDAGGAERRRMDGGVEVGEGDVAREGSGATGGGGAVTWGGRKWRVGWLEGDGVREGGGEVTGSTGRVSGRRGGDGEVRQGSGALWNK